LEQCVFTGMSWVKEPLQWSVSGPVLTATPGDRTDLRRGLSYGFVRDDGHVLHRDVTDVAVGAPISRELRG
jgi:regulation of enolase protein 1 (concanavalin A-like superfamily)